ncbi:MAG: tRNA pseudouridine(38-40) synthase TruA [Planctomycetes bacterium]|jgi:tRNA pseudouridine38-40 synthase|nr:tRNA pseudouridine(38-40) synthase TruA [Planctomycetota bacterium]MDP6423153.1 tRNA pseudouridine(38-40) synthase TruA [Planctomycetota bacterium]
MSNVHLVIAYDGTRYVGWQRQANGISIQEKVERGIQLVTGELATVHGAGRTDSGVHALAQSAHVRLTSGPPAHVLDKALNTTLPPDIRVLAAREVPDDFHARFSARGKRYCYRFRTGAVAPPIGRAYFHWCSRTKLDVAAMRLAAAHVRGRQDFAAFKTRARHERESSTTRTVQSIHVRVATGGVDLAVQGDGFLYNMVRTMAGTLLEVGRGKRSPDWVADVLASRDRCNAGPTLPPNGLFLLRVLYPTDGSPVYPADTSLNHQES